MIGFGAVMPLPSWGGGGVRAKWQFCCGKKYNFCFISSSLAQPLQFSGLSFVIVSSLGLVFLVEVLIMMQKNSSPSTSEKK